MSLYKMKRGSGYRGSDKVPTVHNKSISEPTYDPGSRIDEH